MKVEYNGIEFNGLDHLVTGTDLRSMRLKGRQTTVEMAELVGIKTRKTIENWETNKGQPSLNQFILLALKSGFEPGLLISEYLRRGSTSIADADPNQINWDACRIAEMAEMAD